MDKLAIAFLDKKGRGLTPTEPYIHENIDGIDDAEKQKQQLINDGYGNVTIFRFEESEQPDYITWGFISHHKVS